MRILIESATVPGLIAIGKIDIDRAQSDEWYFKVVMIAVPHQWAGRYAVGREIGSSRRKYWKPFTGSLTLQNDASLENILTSASVQA